MSISRNLTKKDVNEQCKAEFGWENNYESLNEQLKEFLRNSNPKIFFPCKVPYALGEKDLKKELVRQRELRKDICGITLIGKLIVILWNIDYLVIPGIKRYLKRRKKRKKVEYYLFNHDNNFSDNFDHIKHTRGKILIVEKYNIKR